MHEDIIPFFTDMYDDHLVPLLSRYLQPHWDKYWKPMWDNNVAPMLKSAGLLFLAWKNEHGKDMVDDYLHPIFFFFSEKIHIVFYYATTYDLEELPIRVWIALQSLFGWLASLLDMIAEQMTSVPLVVAVFGDYSKSVTFGLVNGFLLLLLLRGKRLIFGLGALALMVVLSPLYLLLFIFSLCYGKKKAKKSLPKSRMKKSKENGIALKNSHSKFNILPPHPTPFPSSSWCSSHSVWVCYVCVRACVC